MTVFPLPDWEIRRITALYQLEILDTPSEKEYDHIVALAAQVCSRPVVTLGFLDHNRVWYKAKIGIDVQEAPRHEADHTENWQEGTAIQIEDTLRDERSANHFFAVNPPYIRSVAIYPLITENGEMLGHLSIADTKPGLLTQEQFAGLEMLALQTMSLLKLRLQIIRKKQMQHHSKRTLEQISPVFKNAIDAVIVTTREGVVCQWNPKAEEMFGYKAKEAIGQRFHQLLIHESRHERYFEQLRNFKVNEAGELDRGNFEFVAIRNDKSELHVALGISLVTIDGKALFIGFMSDITERKQIARELAKQKSFYENILNKIPMDIAVFDADHRYLYVNPFSVKDEQLRHYIIGKDDFEYATYRNRDNTIPLQRRSQFLKAKVTRRVVSWEDQVKDKEGNLVTHIRKLFPVYNESGSFSFVIGYGIDITDRKKLEEEQNMLLKRLSFQNTQLIDFCNIVTHNLRGPLNNMSMLVDFVEESENPEEQRELVGKLKPVIEGLNSTFNELVETIQIKQDLEIKSEVVHLENCLKKTLKGLEMEVLKANLQLTIDCHEAPEVYFPPKYVASIFHNLISNALKYRSPQRQLQIHVSSHKKGSACVLIVKDNGLGIDLCKHKDHVFKIGKVFHSHANAKGLGLYMTKSQVDVMGGTIEVESEVDKGTCFTIEFKGEGAAE
jgi:PAS domain S-box-containing protein